MPGAPSSVLLFLFSNPIFPRSKDLWNIRLLVGGTEPRVAHGRAGGGDKPRVEHPFKDLDPGFAYIRRFLFSRWVNPLVGNIAFPGSSSKSKR